MSGNVVHVVDDDPALRESLEFLLASAGFTACVYNSAAALLARAPQLEAGCIVTDVRMPEITGLELVARLNQLGVAHPIIVLTGHADVPLAVAAMKAGVAEFLEKPVQDEALIGAIRAALASSAGAAERQAGRLEMGERFAQLTAREREVFDRVAAGIPTRRRRSSSASAPERSRFTAPTS